MSNDVELLAKASFYVTDIMVGRTGSFIIEEASLNEPGGASACMAEIQQILAHLKEAGFVSDKKTALKAPFSHNVRVGVFHKKFGGKKLWVHMVMTHRFGVYCEVSASYDKPW